MGRVIEGKDHFDFDEPLAPFLVEDDLALGLD